MISAVRFFIVSPVHSRYMLLALGTVLACGMARLLTDPRRAVDALGPLALLQMLAASSGFEAAARRGHLDLLLTAGPPRVAVALTHLSMSVLPGLVVWWALGAVEMVAARTWRPLAFSSGSMAAFAVISGAAWALTVRLPRLSGGLAWQLGTMVWGLGWWGGATPMELMARDSGTLARAGAVALCPFVLLGRRLSSEDLAIVMPAAGAAVVCTVAAVVWIARMDVPLESSQ